MARRLGPEHIRVTRGGSSENKHSTPDKIDPNRNSAEISAIS